MITPPPLLLTQAAKLPPYQKAFDSPINSRTCPVQTTQDHMLWTVENLRIKLQYRVQWHTVKKVSDFPVTSRDVTNQTLPGGE
jgi:hypothetical protein